MQQVAPYQPQHKVRIVTAASLFDGHDAAINIMRRIMQSSGAEIIHLGHNRSVQEIVECAIQEDVQGIAITSYQGGHIEFFKYMYDLLKERGAGHIKIFGGGGGTILPSEIAELHQYGITRIYHPDDGRAMGLQGMINDVLQQCDFPVGFSVNGELKKVVGFSKTTGKYPDFGAVARMISVAENNPELFDREIAPQLQLKKTPVLGVTGTGGAGKSSMVDELVRRFLLDFQDKSIAVVSVDPSKRKTGGALLGDRIRMNAIHPALSGGRVYMRSLATRQSNLALSRYVHSAVDILKSAGFDMIILETSGIGQSDTEIVDHSDLSLYVMTPEFGAATQLEKIDMLDFADVIAINKFDKRGALDALRDVRKQVQRNRNAWDKAVDDMPVFGCIASQFNDPGVNQLYRRIIDLLNEKCQAKLHSHLVASQEMSEKIYIIPPNRTRYLSEISENNRKYDAWAEKQAELARQLFALRRSIDNSPWPANGADGKALLEKMYNDLKRDLDGECQRILEGWAEKTARYKADEYVYTVRDKEVRVKTHTESLSHTRIPRVVTPRFKDWGEILRWSLQENVPGEFPYTAGVFPFKRQGEDPTRMFAGEGGPERTNRRFHYVSMGPACRALVDGFRLGYPIRRRSGPPPRYLWKNRELRRVGLLP
jgi:isobutyryl-CoA mutase